VLNIIRDQTRLYQILMCVIFQILDYEMNILMNLRFKYCLSITSIISILIPIFTALMPRNTQYPAPNKKNVRRHPGNGNMAPTTGINLNGPELSPMNRYEQEFDDFDLF
jgi:hypothetical protein